MSTTAYKLGDITINRLGYGAMQLTGEGVWGDAPDRAGAMRVLKEAVNRGVNFIDTADAYGPNTNETLIADALYPYPKNLLIATKGGFERHGPGQWVVNGHPDHIKKAIDGNLKRLKLEHIDLWQLHRIDPRVPVEETLGPLADAVKAGKIRYVGLSEAGIPDLEKAGRTIPIVSVQNLYNLGERKWEELVDYTAERGMAFIPWYPLASGPDKLKDKLSGMAGRHSATTAQIALAWMLRRSPNILLIPGTKSLTHLKENLDTAALSLSDEEVASLNKF
jgi:pyridoxine 4-dehydrogenase